MTVLDPRVNAYRDDLAAAGLQNRVRVPKYSDGEPRQVPAPVIPLRAAPRFDAPLLTEALSGETLMLYDVKDGWGWVQLREDGYVGYTPLDGLSTQIEENTHRVSARLTYLYPAPDIKRPPITKYSFSCTVSPIAKPDGRFIELSRGGFVFADHLVGAKERARDFVRVAERFVGAPYLWGGKTTLGIDCSGLVQISLQAAGVACPRDSDMQRDTVGAAADLANLDAIQRGDLLFWEGHVAIAQSPDWMLHASALHMEVVVEPIRRAVERIAESHGPILAIKRVPVDAVAQVQAAVQAAGPSPAPGSSQDRLPSTSPVKLLQAEEVGRANLPAQQSAVNAPLPGSNRQGVSQAMPPRDTKAPAQADAIRARGDPAHGNGPRKP